VWAFQQLETLGYIEFSKDRQEIGLTDKGRCKARDILESLPICDRLLVQLASADAIASAHIKVEEEG